MDERNVGTNASSVSGTWWALKFLSIIASTMSVVMLINYGFEGRKWSLLAQLTIDFWENLLNALLVKIVPLTSLLNWLLRQFTNYIGLSQIPKLYPHWKHVFVLLMLIYGSFARALLFKERRYFFGGYALVISIIASLIAAVIVGVVRLAAGDWLANFVVAVVPALLFWISIYLVWLPKGGFGKHDFRDLVTRSIATITILAVVTWVSISVYHLNVYMNIGLLCLACVVIYVAVNRISYGYRVSKETGGSFWSNPYTQRGVTILQGFVGAFVYIILNAFLNLAQQ